MKPVVCVASGPSLTMKQVRLIAKEKAAGRCDVIAINDTVYPCWFADYLYACDNAWWAENGPLERFGGQRVTLHGNGEEPPLYPGICSLECTGVSGYDPRYGKIRSGGNSGYQAVHMAAQFGYDDIVLVGYDFSADGARDHWFGRHDGRMDKHSNSDQWLVEFRNLTDILHSRGVLVRNATNMSRITWLQRATLEGL